MTMSGVVSAHRFLKPVRILFLDLAVTQIQSYEKS